MSGSPASRARVALVATGAAIVVAALGMLSTDLGPWFFRLVQPSWKPPDLWFGPAWTTIFTLAALAGIKGWHAARNHIDRHRMLALFAVNGLLNAGWSLLFFRLRRPDWALWEVALLWLSIAALIGLLWHWSRPAAALLAPYLCWVTFAAVLNLSVVRLNGPFGPA
jgi:translocator protein